MASKSQVTYGSLGAAANNYEQTGGLGSGGEMEDTSVNASGTHNWTS